MKTPERIKCDAQTRKWCLMHPFTETTIVKCDKCGLYYKPSLGHKCKMAKKEG